MRFYVRIFLYAALGLGCYGCILISGNKEAPFEMQLVVSDSNSLMDVHGSFQLSFTQKIRSKQILFQWNPVFYSYRVELAGSCDSTTVYLLEDLDYNTLYSISGTDSCVSENGDTLENQVTFLTIRGEQEPNDSRSTADTIETDTPWAGYLYPKTDQDWFCFEPETNADSVFVIVCCANADLRVSVYGPYGAVPLVSTTFTNVEADTLAASASDTGTYALKVESLSGTSTGIRYRVVACPSR